MFMRCEFINVNLLVMVKLQSIVSCGITCGSFQDLTVFTADNFQCVCIPMFLTWLHWVSWMSSDFLMDH